MEWSWSRSLPVENRSDRSIEALNDQVYVCQWSVRLLKQRTVEFQRTEIIRCIMEGIGMSQRHVSWALPTSAFEFSHGVFPCSEPTHQPHPLTGGLCCLKLGNQPGEHPGRIVFHSRLEHPEILLVPKVGVDADETHAATIDVRVASIIRSDLAGCRTPDPRLPV